MDWKTEPDEKKWQHEGLDCKIVRNHYLGHLCGYVRIPEGHPLHKVEYHQPLPESLASKMREDVFCFNRDNPHAGVIFDVHGGVTFSGAIKDEEGFWYGFDCCHYGDLAPYNHFPESVNLGGKYRDIEYVTKETNSLAEQMSRLK